MSDSNLPPERWRSLFDNAGIEFGYRKLAAHIGTTHTRVRRVLRNEGTSEDALREVADAFRVPVSKVRELRGEPAVEIEPFILPDDAGRLTSEERDVIRSVIRALLKARDNHVVETTSESDASPEVVEGEEVLRVVSDRTKTGEPPLRTSPIPGQRRGKRRSK